MANKINIIGRAFYILLLFVFIFIGCATPTSLYVYTLPIESKYDNVVFVDRPFSVVWDELAMELSISFYVINNIEKASGIINVSYLTDTPGEYIDCGAATKTCEKGTKNTLSYKKTLYTYEIAESSSYKSASKAGKYGQYSYDMNVNRKTSLEGRVNIYLEPEGNGTNITVNCRYIFKANVFGSYVTLNALGEAIESGNVPPSTKQIVFNTNQEKTSNWGTPDKPEYITCHSTGKLEQEILGLVKQ